MIENTTQQLPSCEFATIPKGVVLELVGRRVGRNGWAVMVALCRKLCEDGLLGTSPAKEVSRFTGLTSRQVAHGMEELRGKGVIAPVVRKNMDGAWVPDRSRFGHAAQYRITKDVWAAIEVDSERAEAQGEPKASIGSL